MAEGKERDQARLENLETIEPMLGSLRVLSLSTMQMALNRLATLDQYAQRFHSIAVQLRHTAAPTIPETDETSPSARGKRVLAVLGSTRGIAGQYNRQLARAVRLALEDPEDEPYTILAYGKRVQTCLSQEKVGFEPHEALNTGSLPHFEQASKQIRQWMEDIDKGRIVAVDVLSFRRQQNSESYLPQIHRLLPTPRQIETLEQPTEAVYPEPVIEGNPEVLLAKISDQLTAIQFYEWILQAIAAENLFRFRLLEEAKENTTNLLEELRQSIQMEHRKEITQQLQELLAASGMLAER